MGQRGKKIGKINSELTDKILRGYESVDGASPNMVIERLAKINSISVATVRKILALNGVDLYDKDFTKKVRPKYKLHSEIIEFIDSTHSTLKGTYTERAREISSMLNGSVTVSAVYKHLKNNGLIDPSTKKKILNSEEKESVLERYKVAKGDCDTHKYRSVAGEFGISMWTVRNIVKSESKTGYFNPRMEMF